MVITGRDLMMEGIPAGPGLGEVLSKLLDLVIEDPKRNEKTWLLAKAKEIYKASREESPRRFFCAIFIHFLIR